MSAAGEERRALIVLLSVIFLMIAGFGLVIPLLPFFAKAFDAPAWQVTLMFSAFSFGQFLEKCAARDGYCVPTPEVMCAEQLLAHAYQTQGSELTEAGALLDRYQRVAREAYLGRQLAAFQIDTTIRLEWLRTSEAM